MIKLHLSHHSCIQLDFALYLNRLYFYSFSATGSSGGGGGNKDIEGKWSGTSKLETLRD